MKDKLHLIFLLVLIAWAIIGTVVFAANGWPLRSIGSAVTAALLTLRVSRLLDEMKEEAAWEDIKRHPRI